MTQTSIKRRHNIRISSGDSKYEKVAICAYCGQIAYHANRDQKWIDEKFTDSCPLGIEVEPLENDDD